MPRETSGLMPTRIINSLKRLMKSRQITYRELARRIQLSAELCDFFYPAVVRRGDLQIAISTAGQSPSLAQRLRRQLERQFGPGYTEWVAQLGETRRLILASPLDKECKWELLHSLASREAFEAALAKLARVEQEELSRRELEKDTGHAVGTV